MSFEKTLIYSHFYYFYQNILNALFYNCMIWHIIIIIHSFEILLKISILEITMRDCNNNRFWSVCSRDLYFLKMFIICYTIVYFVSFETNWVFKLSTRWSADIQRMNIRSVLSHGDFAETCLNKWQFIYRTLAL